MRGPRDRPECQPGATTLLLSDRGPITVICGCMFSGKTTELLRRLSAFPASAIVAFKHVIDRRYQADAVVSHEGLAWPAVPIASPAEITNHLRRGIEVIAVDEGHFFDVSLVDIVRDLAARGSCVIVTSLDRDSWGRPFAVADGLLSLADEPLTRHAVCTRCGSPADRTQRLTPIVDRNMVGGPESYESRCRSCWVLPPEPPPN